MEGIWAQVPDAAKFDAGSLGPDGTGIGGVCCGGCGGGGGRFYYASVTAVAGVIDFKLWPVEEWKACGAYRCFKH
jgi:hypothetical protein